MTHWFDTAVKAIANRDISRRGAIAAGIGMAAGAAQRGFGLSPVSMAFAQNAAASPCVRRNNGAAAITQFIASESGITVDKQVSYDRAKRTGAMRVTVKRGSTVIVQIDSGQTSDGQHAVRFTYGNEVGGIKNAILYSRDGHSFTGTIDGRQFTSGAVRSLSEVHFADGKPAPQVRFDASLNHLSQSLLRRANVGLATCKGLPVMQTRSATTTRSGYRTGPGDNWHLPGSHGAPACDHCLNDTCGGQFADCAGQPDDLANLVCPPCYAARIVACEIKYFACLAGCYLPGRGCCPVLCGTPVVDNCCADNETCMQPNHTCCPAGHVVCRDRCCDSNVNTCASDGLCGCPVNTTPCGDQCCQHKCCGSQCCSSNDMECCGGTCCPRGSVCLDGKVCCTAPSHVCGGKCCAPFNHCCNNVCCGNNEVCLGNQCCPSARQCGSVCCPNGQTCQDPRTGHCVGARTCPSGLRPCRSMNTAGAYVTTCCPSLSSTCCNGQCCPPGHACCTYAGKLGCWPQGNCVPH